MSTVQADTSVIPAEPIIEQLKSQAASILKAALGVNTLEQFAVGSLGNLPYYWQDPSDPTLFNAKTYPWISAALKASPSDVKQLDQSFNSAYIGVLGKVSYSLSTDDQATLNQAQKNATNQQMALLNLWLSIYKKYPDGNGQPIDNVLSNIATTWASPATTLYKIKNATNLNKLLNQTPASGQPVLPILANYLNALGSAISLQNNSTMNQAYLGDALDNVQNAAANNGGLLLNNNDYRPAYAVATPLADIVNGLSKVSNAVSVTMTVSRSSDTEFSVSVSGGGSFRMPIAGFLTLTVGGSASYFSDQIATSANKTTVEMTFTGVTLVTYGPVSYDLSNPDVDWYWTKPITDAIKNGSNDVSGFKFSPNPQVDFSTSGPFGFVTGAAISNYPSVKITVESSNYESIQKTFQQNASVGVSFLGIPLGIGGSESSYSNSVEVDSSKETITITLNPPKELVAGTSLDSVGWVLGVVTEYPGAGA